MMSRMLGAPLGGTIRGGHQGLESFALSLMIPPNFGGGGGSCFPSMVVVALGEPGSPVVCWAEADNAIVKMKAPTAAQRNNPLLITSSGRSNRQNVLVDCLLISSST